MKRIKNIFWILLIAVPVFMLDLSSCSQIGFDVTLKPADITDIDLSALSPAPPLGNYVIKVETYVETGDMGVNLPKLIYDYTIKNRGSSTINIEVRLSLQGEVTSGNEITILVDSDSDGYPDADNIYLSSAYKDTVSSEGYGWVSMIGTPGTPVALNGNVSITNETVLNDNPVVNRILKQKGIWIEAYVSPNGGLPGSGDYMDIVNQAIKAAGSKDTGYSPGVFSTM